MRPTEVLKDEHQGIKSMLKILKKACEKMHGGTAVPHEHLEHMVEFLKVFVDKCHHAKEEELLFPAMLAARVPGAAAPIRALLDEHRRGRSLVFDIAASVARCRSGDHRAPAKIVTEMQVYRDLLIQHIEKEETVLFPMADEGLAREAQDALVGGFRRVEEEKIVAGAHERFHAMLRRMQEVYLRE